jgi:hypothetical protein
MRPSPSSLLLVAALTASCASTLPSSEAVDSAATASCRCEVVFSVANQDPDAPMASIDVLVDGHNLIHGPFMQTAPGEYLYFSTCLQQQSARITARSSARDSEVTVERSVSLADHAWIVLTRVRNLDGEPSLELEISYEEPTWQRREKAAK